MNKNSAFIRIEITGTTIGADQYGKPVIHVQHTVHTPVNTYGGMKCVYPSLGLEHNTELHGEKWAKAAHDAWNSKLLEEALDAETP